MPAVTPAVDVAASLTYPGQLNARATATLRYRSRADRTAAVVRTWALCWLAAVLAVFLPLLHFVLVPALLVGGPLYALSLRHESATLLRASGPCPACGQHVEFAQPRRAVPRVALRCDGCGRLLVLELAADDLAPRDG